MHIFGGGSEMALNQRKVAMVGCGSAGAASCFALMQSGLFTEMVLIDAYPEKAEGEAMDIAQGLTFSRPMKIYAGTYDDLADAAIQALHAGAGLLHPLPFAPVMIAVIAVFVFLRTAGADAAQQRLFQSERLQNRAVACPHTVRCYICLHFDL